MDLIIFVIILTLIVLFEIIIGIFFIFRKKEEKIEEFEKEETKKNSLLCRFVMEGADKKLGESVAVDDDILIIKNGSNYLGVPLKHIEEEGKTLLVKGLVDHSRAEEIGENWRKDSHNVLSHPEKEDKK